jgi:hypothetical protein
MLSIEESKEISTILDRVKDLDTRADLLSQDDIDALGEHRARLRARQETSASRAWFDGAIV